jgi:hypothetical protein
MNKDTRVSFALPKAGLDLFDEAAKRQGMNRSALLRSLVSRAIEGDIGLDKLPPAPSEDETRRLLGLVARTGDVGAIKGL